MKSHIPHQLPPEPPPAVMAAIRERIPASLVEVLGLVFALRTTARQVDNLLTDWMAGTAGSTSRFQIMALLWAAKGRAVPHKEIVATLEVTRATVSGLMAGLERDGLVKSAVARDDRRNLLATLTAKGRAIFEKAFETNLARMSAIFASFPPDELVSATEHLQRIRQVFASANLKESETDRPARRRGSGQGTT
ncbi:MarR family winged helix-turn-helix transcriptional regulator [Rhodovastum atsumiense]|uniref:Winged helix DNA-binding protein n=1 Tax=Rhodovastum atsumiense TaxID=504468 RepID=A0A5M6IS86_9PROT|nr:transcriptional regulator [Rhodovastum atsumiense]KAA5611163.1 winged helix DNA-binding protein [Rhodovastum atsumiense]